MFNRVGNAPLAQPAGNARGVFELCGALRALRSPRFTSLNKCGSANLRLSFP